MAGRFIIVGVDADDDRDVFVFARRGDEHAARPCLKVPRGSFAMRELARGFDDDVDAEISPRQPRRIALGEQTNGTSVDDEATVLSPNVAAKTAVHRIVSQKMGQRLGRITGVDGHDAERRVADFDQAAEYRPPDASKPVDGDVDRHDRASFDE